MSACAVEGCTIPATKRCSRCHSAQYCSVDHQKAHWSTHKPSCAARSPAAQTQAQPSANEESTQVKAPTSSSGAAPAVGAAGDQRLCRCMFCGQELQLASEDQAVDHLQVCSAFQEQVQSKDQFTIPSVLKDKMKPNP